jgi:hypothetical protein
MPVHRRTAKLEEIDQFIACRGATKIPSRFVGTVNGALPIEEERQRIAALEAKLNADTYTQWGGRPRRGRPRVTKTPIVDVKHGK